MPRRRRRSEGERCSVSRHRSCPSGFFDSALRAVCANRSRRTPIQIDLTRWFEPVWLNQFPCFVLRDAFVRSDHLRTPEFRQVFEGRIDLLDEVELLLASPAFELLFTRDGGANVFILFVVEETGSAVGLGEASKVPFRCCRMRVKRSLVTPMYRVPVWLLRM